MANKQKLSLLNIMKDIFKMLWVKKHNFMNKFEALSIIENNEKITRK